VEADPARLTQIVNNLLENASKFTPEGGSIELSLRHEGDEAVIHVRDTGRGIAPDLLPHIFETFAQGEVSLAREEGGLGLGLALVKNLTELHGGRVSAASEGIGKGTELTVCLPAIADTPPVTLPQDLAKAARPGKRRILVAEDNAAAAEGLARVLQHAGHEVRVAADGAAALAAARNDLPAIAILDIGLPTVDGFELAQSLRRLPGGQRLLLIALTGYSQDADLARTKAAGFDYHLVKPADMDQLLKIIATWEPPGQT
jgi:CheY-like chemotaxis protein